MNMITCGSDCIYQKDGYCCLNFITEINGAAVEGCHYYKQNLSATDVKSCQNMQPIENDRNNQQSY